MVVFAADDVSEHRCAYQTPSAATCLNWRRSSELSTVKVDRPSTP